jgi:hypothetical protein
MSEAISVGASSSFERGRMIFQSGGVFGTIRIDQEMSPMRLANKPG